MPRKTRRTWPCWAGWPHEISNVLEDAAMENRVLERFPGTLGQALDFVRAWQWREMPTVTQLKEREAQGMPMFYGLLQLFLSYGKFGELKYGEESLSEEHIQTVFELLPLLDDDLRATSGKKRWNTVNCILIRCWEHVREYLEALKCRYEEKKASGGTGSVFSQLEEELSTLVGGSTRGEGSTAPVSEESEEPSLPQPEKRRKPVSWPSPLRANPLVWVLGDPLENRISPQRRPAACL